MSAPSVVVTGLGATTPLAGDVSGTWQAVLDGRSAPRALDDLQWVKDYDLPVRIAARLAVEPIDALGYHDVYRQDRCAQVALVAARQAWADAGLNAENADPLRVGVVIGTGFGCVESLLSQHRALNDGLRAVVPQAVPMIMPNGPAAQVGLALKARAGVHAPMSACASGAEALAMGARMIRDGVADVVVAGGAEACITPVIMAGFIRARSMSTRNDEPDLASRPFDTGRNGFVLGEGAGAMVLERAEHAEARGATVHGRLAGVGITNDSHHITSPDPGHGGQLGAIHTALREAGLSPADIGHVNAHATSTNVGDAVESGTITSAFGADAVVTAPKGALGHLLGASGAVEAIITLLSIRDGVVPPTANLTDPDQEIHLDLVRGAPRTLAQHAAVSQSFGFGGHNVVLAFTG
ncbi:beta-ketoacyl-[acyl-carrier-protein] synthase family protein [Micromonospora sp. NPDC048935]|uniref:beta-ketoacyl-[acyl-carrier-protein] synthase family protein n=1 Tax=Micromonospora sp. NPDC048935 TaxID=3364262 RepID=UPI0037155BDA